MSYILFAEANARELACIQPVVTVFAERGYRTETVTDGREALRLLRAELPYALVTNIVLPHRDGVELIRDLLELYPDRKPGILLLCNISVDTGGLLGLVKQMHATVDGIVIKRFHTEARDPRPHISYQQQLTVSLGHLLYGMDLEPAIEA